jgi:hypothetical protein
LGCHQLANRLEDNPELRVIQITATSAEDAATYVKNHAGCRVGGLDEYDQALIDKMEF